MAKKSQSAQDRERDERDRAAGENGTIYLNFMFSRPNPVRKVFGNYRISKAERFWWGLSAIFIALFLLILKSFVGVWGPFYIVTNWWSIPLWAVAGGYPLRNLANASPLKRETGESSGVWIKLVFARVLKSVDRWWRRQLSQIGIDAPRTQMTQLSTYKSTGRRNRVATIAEAEVWMGTAPLPESKLYDSRPVDYIPGKTIFQQSDEYLDRTRGNPYFSPMHPKSRYVPR